MIVAAKLLIVSVWLGAGFSKFGRHFPNVVPPMVSNTPVAAVQGDQAAALPQLPARPAPVGVHRAPRARARDVRRARPAARAAVLAQPHRDARGGAVHGRLPPVHHLDVPAGGAAGVERGVHVPDARSCSSATRPRTATRSAAWARRCSLVTLAGLLFFPMLGNLRPDLVSFLPSMRQYAGNWASAMWAFAPGCEQKLNEHIVKPALMQKEQLQLKRPLLGYDERVAEVVMQSDAGLAVDAQPGPWVELGDDATPGRRHRHLHAARGRVQLQRDHRLQLRRRPPAQPPADRGDPEALPASPQASSRRLGRVRAGVQRPPAILGDGRSGGHRRARQLGGQGRGRGAPWLPDGPIPNAGRLAARRLRARQPRPRRRGSRAAEGVESASEARVPA